MLALATFVISDKEKSAAIYRKFDRLATGSLLTLQSELLELEARQCASDDEDKKAALALKATTRNWAAIVAGAQDPANDSRKTKARA